MTTSPTTVGVECSPISAFSRSALHLLAVLVDHHADLEIDDALVAERGDGLAGLGVERHEAIAGRDVDHAFVALAVGPVGHAAARKLARGPARGALAFVHAVDPLLLARASHRARRQPGACPPVA